MVPSLPPEDWQIVPFIYCCCGVMRYALYSWRFSKKKFFTSQYIYNRSHLGLKKICQAIFVFIGIHVDPQFIVVRISQTGVYTCLPQSVAQHIKMYLNNVLLKMGQGPYVFIISQQCATLYLPQKKSFRELKSTSQFPCAVPNS